MDKLPRHREVNHVSSDEGTVASENPGRDRPARSRVDPDGEPAAVLQATHERVRALATADGDFHVGCVTTGACPEPVSEAVFATPEDAEAAVTAARRYREALRTLDPTAPEYDLAVYGTHDESVSVATFRERTGERRANGLPRSRRVATVSGGCEGEWFRMENAPVVFLSRNDTLIDDEAVGRQLDTKL